MYHILKYSQFGPWLGSRLRERHLSFSRFAERVGVQKTAVLRWIDGRRLPMNDTVPRIGEALELDPSSVWAVIESEGIPGVSRPASPVLPLTEGDAGRPFALWLRAELAARDWTAVHLARQLGVNAATIRRWSKGRGSPASLYVPRIAEALGVPVERIREILA